MSLSREDDLLLSVFGTGFLYNFANMCPQLILYGVYACLFPYAVLILLRKPLITRPIGGLLATTLLLFLAYTLNVIASIEALVVEVQQYLINFGGPLKLRTELVNDHLTSPARLKVFSGCLTYVLADAIVMWRAWVIYNRCRVAQTAMIVLMTTNSAVFLGLAIVAMKDILQYENGEKYVALNSASTFTSATTNLIASALICRQLWNHRQSMGVLRWRRTRVEAVLVFLVETGLVFGITQMLNAFLQHFDFGPESAVDRAASIVGQLTMFFAALFPTLIIILAGQKDMSIVRSTIAVEDMYQNTRTVENTLESGNAVSTIQFASMNTRSEETQSGRSEIVVHIKGHNSEIQMAAASEVA